MIEVVTFYDPATGVVLSSGKTVAPELVCPRGASMLHGVEASPEKDMVRNGAVCPRPEMRLRVAGNILYGVPRGGVLTIEGQRYEADGSAIELEFGLPGVYQIAVSAPPYLDGGITYEVEA